MYEVLMYTNPVKTFHLLYIHVCIPSSLAVWKPVSGLSKPQPKWMHVNQRSEALCINSWWQWAVGVMQAICGVEFSSSLKYGQYSRWILGRQGEHLPLSLWVPGFNLKWVYIWHWWAVTVGMLVKQMCGSSLLCA